MHWKGKHQDAIKHVGSRDKTEAPSHFAWGHRGVSGAHKWLQNYELCVEVDGWVKKGSPRELQPWGLEKVDVA